MAIYSWCTHATWWFSIVMVVYQTGTSMASDVSNCAEGWFFGIFQRDTCTWRKCAQVNMEQGFLTHIDPKLDTCLAKPTYSQFYAKLNIDMSIPYWYILDTLWLFNVAMENGPFIDDFPINTSICKGFSMAMLNNQMVYLAELQFYLK